MKSTKQSVAQFHGNPITKPRTLTLKPKTSVPDSVLPLRTKTEVYNTGLVSDLHDLRKLAPVGTISMYAGHCVPDGWLFCSGEEVCIAEYEELYDVIGDLYGGACEGKFRIPNLRGRVPVGVNHHACEGISIRCLGNTGGNETSSYQNLQDTGSGYDVSLYADQDNMQPFLVVNYIIKY